MDFEDILLEVGDYGKYQRDLILIFLLPAASLLPWFTMNVLFMVSVPDHWCAVPELAAFNLTDAQQRSLISPPGEHCHRYNINYTDIPDIANYSMPNETTTLPCDRGWQYDTTDYESTAATQWNMVCSDDHYTSLVLSLYNVGSIIGTPIYGSLSDRIGRRITFFITIIVTAVTAISSVLMTNFTAFIVLKTLNGSLMPSVFQLPYIIVLEIVGPEMRTRMNGLVNLSWTVGLCFLPLLAYYCRNWVTLGLITSAVTIIFFFYYKFLPESPRWLVSQERYEEAAIIMNQIGVKNGKVQDKNTMIQMLQKLGEKMKKEKTVDGVQNSSADLLKYPQLRKKFIIITFCWMANIMSYYGLQLNVSNLAGNEFVNFFLLSVVEIPGYLTSWVVMERFGRRWCSVTGFLLTGFVCMLPSIDLPYIDVVSSMIGKFFAAGTFMATYQQSSELYPTVVRSLGMGMSSTVAMVATLIVPYLVYLGVYGKAIPFVIIGLFGIVAGISAAFLPETLNEHLPQTIFDAEVFGKDQKFFSYNRRRHSLSKERAASFSLKVKGMATLAGREESPPKSQRTSQILQKDFVQGCENSSVVTAESVKTLNGVPQNVRKRNSTDSSTKEVYAIGNISASAAQNSIAENTRKVSSASVQNIDDKRDTSSRKSSARFSELGGSDTSNKESIHLEATNKDKFSYVNMVFDNNNDIAINDKVADREETKSKDFEINSKM